MRRLVLLACSLSFAFGCGTDMRPAPDAGTGDLREFGEPCLATEDCVSGLCILVGPTSQAVCTRPCTSNADCPSDEAWGCVLPEDFDARVCGCLPDGAEEICGDGRDNDCDGLTDDCRLCGGLPVADNDPRHCGTCGNACNTDQSCIDGDCRCTEATASDCGDRCAQLTSDVANCGACGNVCPLGQDCVDGACTCRNPATPDHCPDVGCVDLASDSANCGSCGTACAAGRVCRGGSCACDVVGLTDCGSAGCVDTDVDITNCGACGTTCGPGGSCVSGSCVCPASTPDTCAGSCVSLASDRSNCGACGTVCPSGSSCTGGVCRCATTGYQLCDGRCISTRTDPSNCGGCGVACLPGAFCSFGTCVCSSGVVCGGECKATTDTFNCGGCGIACGAGQVCSSGTCRCSSTSLTVCGGACVNLRNDPTNCGACGAGCRPTEVCSSSSCTCPSGTSWCDSAGACVALSSDTSNCGTCGNACNPTEVCSSGTCRCSSSLARFCASAGACVDTYANDAHCGACDVACPAGTACSARSCRCTDTSLTLCGASCVDLLTDTDDCGACGNTCSPLEICSAGACVCPPPTINPEVRVTNSPDWEHRVDVASNGTRVAVVYSSTFDGTSVWFELREPDGTPVAGTVQRVDTAATNTWPQVVWNGTTFVVAYIERVASTDHLMLRHYDSTGSPSAPIDVTTGAATPTLRRFVGFEHSPISGYALVDTQDFQYLGATGTSPTPIQSIGISSCTDLHPSPSGQWGVLRADFGDNELLVFNPDGSLTSPGTVLPPFWTETLFDAALSHDGTTWVLLHYEWGTASGMTEDRVVLRRGPALADRYDVFASPRPSGAFDPILGSLELSAAGSDFLLGFAVNLTSTGDRQYRVARWTTSGASPREVSAPAPIVTSSTVTLGQQVGLCYGDSDTVSLFWTDSRWPTPEIYAASLETGGCR